MVKKQGKISVVAKTGGIKIKGDDFTWYNPVEEIKGLMTPELKGLEVEINVGDRNYFNIMVDLTTGKIIADSENGTAENVEPHNPEPTAEEIENLNKQMQEAGMNTEFESGDEMDGVEVVPNIPGGLTEKETPPATPKEKEDSMPSDEVQKLTENVRKKQEEKHESFGDFLAKAIGGQQVGVSSEEVEKLLLHKLESAKIKTGNLSLTYASWAEVWGELIKLYPNAQVRVYENEYGMPYFADSTGGFVKVGVKINGLERINYLPILDYSNKTIPKEKINAFNINKSIQRCMVKACAMHGLGLYIYKGEDFPSEE